MKAVIEHTIVAVIAVGMALIGYKTMQHYGNGAQELISWNATGWTILFFASVVTWVWLYRMCRRLHWLVLPGKAIRCHLLTHRLPTAPRFSSVHQVRLSSSVLTLTKIDLPLARLAFPLGGVGLVS
jgi:hypothetical protein